MKYFLVVLTLAILGIEAQFFKDGKNIAYFNEFETYKENFNKTYPDISTEAYARFCFIYNKRRIDLHNLRYDRGRETYSLRENQFTDMRFIRFRANFPEATPLAVSNDSPLPVVPNVAPAEFNFTASDVTIMDQGLNCNSGWAYAAARSIEILQNTSEALSAQNLIDCAGGPRACINQVPQTAFDFLTQFGQNLYAASEYPRNPAKDQEPMCVIPNNATTMSTLRQYARLSDGNDDDLMRYVGAGYPVVVEFNPTSFEFMHYGEGIFQPPLQSRGSHFMLVVGYGTDELSGLNYWTLLNSFGADWGEEGVIRIERIASKPITKNAIFPLLEA